MNWVVAAIIITAWIVVVLGALSFVNLIAVNLENKMDQWAWYRFGVDNKYCTEYFCDTHDGIPMSDQEIESWEEGNDDCYWVIRLIETETGEEDE